MAKRRRRTKEEPPARCRRTLDLFVWAVDRGLIPPLPEA